MKKSLLLLLVLVTGLAAWAQTFTVENTNNQFIIKRSGSNLPAQTVRYRTVSLSALAGIHFTNASDTLNFGAGDTQRTVMVTENTSFNEVYRFQTTTARSYRFEVLEYNGTFLASVDRNIEFGSSYQHTASYVNKSVTDLVYFDNSGNIKSGSGNKYLDVSYSSPNWIQVDDGGYSQAVHTISTGDLFHGSNALRTYLNNQNNKMYATVYFQQKEEQDGYQYIQILADNASTYDGNDPNGAVNAPSTSLYKACFILSYDPSGSVMSDTHYQFFPHRYDYVDKAAEISAGITNYEFDYDNSHLYQQKYKASSYNAANNGALNLATSVKSLNVRFDAAGSGGDDWDFKNLKVRLALVDETKPAPVAANAQVSSGPYASGVTVYVSVPFSEIVTASSSAKLTTSWGTLSYFGGSGSNVLTFSGNINATVGTQLTISALSSGITDLAGNALSTSSVYKQFNATVIAKHAINLPSETPYGTVTCDKTTALAGETVTLTATPEYGYTIASITVMAGGIPIETTAGAENSYTFTMPDADVTVAVNFISAGLHINATNFPDDNFRNWLLAQDYGSNEWLSDDEIAGITYINVYNTNIANLTGIEHFTALTDLYCEKNQLTSLDVSHNTALTTLVCDNNQLTSLDVSHNTALLYLFCDSNQIASLDLTHNTSLKQLGCYSNKINAANMKKLVSSLCDVGFGLFIAINPNDANEHNVITTTQVAAAYAKGWLVFDTNGNEYGGSEPVLLIDSINFPDAKFRNYLLGQDYGTDGVLTDEELANLTDIYVESMRIADLTGIEHFTALECLYCFNNQLTSIDVSQNTALKRLDLRGNQLTALDVSQNTALRRLDCAFNQLDSIDVSNNTGMFAFYCSGNNITSLDVSYNTELDLLYCDDNQLTSIDVSNNTALTSFSCDDNLLTSLDLSHNTALRSFGCNNNQLTALDVSHNTDLIEFECSGNQLTALDLSGLTMLNFFCCYDNQISGNNMKALVASLPTVDYNYWGGRNGTFRVINLDSSTEQNVITTTQVATATGKHWDVIGIENGDWMLYDGSEPTTVPGDVNGDGDVTASDVTALYNFLLTGDDSDITNGDMNGDGTITSADITAVYSILLGSKGGILKDN